MSHLLVILHHLHQQYSYLPFVLFAIALLIALGSFYNPKTATRYLGFAVAVVLILSFAFVL